MVGVGMIDASEYFAHHNALQRAFHRLKGDEVFHFQTRGGQQLADSLRRVFAVDVLSQPIIGDFHFIYFNWGGKYTKIWQNVTLFLKAKKKIKKHKRIIVYQ